MPFELVQTDITAMPADAIVNAANEQLLPGGGVCGAIFAAADTSRLVQACRAIGHCDTGDAVITPAFGLRSQYIIHTVGPIWRGGTHNEEALLRSCYLRSLALAHEHGLNSIAFPLISAGIFGYPKSAALSAAMESIGSFLRGHSGMTVYLTVFDRGTYELGAQLLRTHSEWGL